MYLEIFRPLAYDVIGDNDSEKGNANECSKDNEVNTTISRQMVFRAWKEMTGKYILFTFWEVASSILSYQAVPRTNNQNSPRDRISRR